jgi:hypothetical protein
MHPVRYFPPDFSKIHSNIIFSSTPVHSEWCHPFRFPEQKDVYISRLSHACYMTHLPHLPLFDHLKNNWWSVQDIKHYSPVSCHLLLPGPSIRLQCDLPKSRLAGSS